MQNPSTPPVCCHSQHWLPHFPQVSDGNVTHGESQHSPPPALCLSLAPLMRSEQERKAPRSQSPGSIIHCQCPSTVALPDTSSQLTCSVSASRSNRAVPTLASTQHKSVIMSCQVFHCSSTGGPQSYSPAAAHERSCLILYFLQ